MNNKYKYNCEYTYVYYIAHEKMDTVRIPVVRSHAEINHYYPAQRILLVSFENDAKMYRLNDKYGYIPDALIPGPITFHASNMPLSVTVIDDIAYFCSCHAVVVDLMYRIKQLEAQVQANK